MLLVASVILAAVSCEKEPVEVLKPEILVDSNVVEVAHKGAEYKIPYEIKNPVDGEELSAVTESDWITIVSVDLQNIILDVKENTSGSTRQGNILLKYKDAQDVSLTVSQAFNPAEITLSGEKTKCDYRGGDFEITVDILNPVDGLVLEISTEDEWIADPTLTENRVTFRVAENNSGSKRNGKIIFKYGESKVSHAVEQSFEAAEIKAAALQECTEQGGDYTISFTITNPRENEKLQVKCDADWITDLNVEEEKITFSVPQNEDSERSAVLLLSYMTAEDWRIDVVQAEAAYQYESENLSANGTANSYIVSASGDYRLKAVKGNGVEKVGEIASVEVLWESFGNETMPQQGDLIKDPRMVNNYVEFTVSDPFKKGNAVLAAKDEAGKILWSWHIWLTEQPEDQVYNNEAGTFMDRNLGATSAVPGESEAIGLLYQWGRKDPFPGRVSGSKEQAKTTITWPLSQNSDSSTGTVDYAIENPTTFIKGNYKNYDWLYTGGGDNDDTRWQSVKTIHDPCPVGYKVPDGGEESVWAKAFGISSFISVVYDKEKDGVNFGASSENTYKLTDASICWYPGTGFIDNMTGLISTSGSQAYWSCTPEDRMAYYFAIYSYGGAALDYSYNRAAGMAVRCVRE